jgi:hypothetical protein
VTAIGYTSGDPRKVSRTGDTMTGDLELLGAADLTVADDVAVGDDQTIGGDLAVTGNARVDGVLTVPYTSTDLNVAQMLTIGASSAILSGGEFTPNADPTKIDIAAFTGLIVDYNSSAPLSPTNPLLTFVSVPAQIGLSLTGPLSQTTTWWLCDSTGTIVQQAPNPTPTQRRTHLTLGATAQFGGFIFIDQTLPVIPSQVGNQLADLMDALRPFSYSGNQITANGANLTVNKDAGTMFARAFSQVPSYLDPHNAVLAAQSPVSCRRATATTVLAPLQTLIDVANYDPGGLGVITPVGFGANTTTNFRVWGFASSTPADQLAVQYGQNTYSSLANAVNGLGSGNFIPNPLFVDGTVLGWISVIRTATDLSNPAQATFTHSGKFAHP